MPDVVDAKIAAIKYDHGTRARYALGKCRCESCREANRTYVREQYQRRHGPWLITAINGPACRGGYVVRHRETGEIVLRTHDRKEALAVRDRRNAKDHGLDGSELVNALRARRRLAALAAQSIGQVAIEKRTKISRTTLHEIASGRVKRIKRSTQDLILAVVPAMEPGSFVPAAPTWALIEQMRSLGKTRAWIAAQLGLDRGLPIGKERVRARTATRILRLWKLVMAEDAQRRAAAAAPTPQAKLREALRGWDADEFAVRLSRFRADDADAVAAGAAR